MEIMFYVHARVKNNDRFYNCSTDNIKIFKNNCNDWSLNQTCHISSLNKGFFLLYKKTKKNLFEFLFK